jgi:hypothetical protein
MHDCQCMATPMNEGIQLWVDMNLEVVDVTFYQQRMESLIFLTHTHLDIAYPMNVVSRFINNPQETHFNATKHIYWYVKGTLEFETFFLHEDNASSIRWVDANWAHDLDNRKSTTWMFFKFGHIPLSWTNKLQPIITLSNTKAKYKSFFRWC